MMKDDPELAPIAKMVSDACVDVSELIDKLDLESILLPAPGGRSVQGGLSFGLFIATWPENP